MTDETEPSATAEGEDTPAPAPAGTPDEKTRAFAADKLSEQMEIGAVLLNQCAHLSARPEGDRVKPLFAAARLMNAQARLAETLATVAKVERVRRTIVEHVQPPVCRNGDLNSILQNTLMDDLSLKLLRYMKLVADENLDETLNEAGHGLPP